MTQKEDELAQTVRGKAPAVNLDNLEATQIVSLDDLKELEHLELARANAAEPARQRRAVIAAGIVLGLLLAAAVLCMIFLRSGGH